MEPTKDRRNEIIAIIIIAAIILCGIAYFLSKSSPAGTPSNTASSTSATTSSTSTSGIVSVTSASSSSSGYTVHLITSGNTPVAPNYKASLVISDPEISASAQESASLRSQFVATQAAITSDTTDANAWIALGDERKEAGDYVGAAADWQYIAELYPSNLVANANLGDLYANFLPDYPKAVAAFKAQIAIDPTDIYIYDDLYQLYTDQYPQSTATIVALLKAGIAANPNAAELKADLAKYQ